MPRPGVLAISARQRSTRNGIILDRYQRNPPPSPPRPFKHAPVVPAVRLEAKAPVEEDHRVAAVEEVLGGRRPPRAGREVVHKADHVVFQWNRRAPRLSNEKVQPMGKLDRKVTAYADREEPNVTDCSRISYQALAASWN
jgi:hypothetical protein